jgi:hypothetical protein
VDTKAPIIQLSEKTVYTNKGNYKLSLAIIESWFDYAMVGEQRIDSLIEGRLIANVSLQEGENKLIILVYDLAGHRSEEHLTLVLDTQAPKLEISQPLPWSKSIRSRIWISGTTDPDAEIFCNDKPLRHIEGSFEGFIPLLPGLNALNFLAVDRAGNEKKYTLPVQYAEKFQAEIFIDKTKAQSSFGEILFDAPPFIEKSYTMVPLRVFAELLGYQIEFEPVFQIITMSEFGGKTIRAQVGNTIFTVNDQKKTLAVAPMIRNGRTFVPLRFFAEEFGFEVSYRKESHSVLLTYHEPTE